MSEPADPPNSAVLVIDVQNPAITFARGVGALLLACSLFAACSATATTVAGPSEADAASTTDAAGSTESLATPSPDPVGTGCPFVSPNDVAEFENGIASMLVGAVTVASGSNDPCVYRFASGDAWIELHVQPADETRQMFGDANLMTNGIDATRATLGDGRVVDVVATTSSPQSISTWDASITGAFVLAGPPA